MPDSSLFDQLSDRYFGWHTTHYSRGWEYRWISDQLCPGPGLCGLDAGAGKSPLPFHFAERGARVFTVDSGAPDENAEWGFFDYSRLHPAITSYNTDFCRLPWAQTGQFDFVVSASVIEHLPAEARREAWREFSRVLMPGGQLILTIDLQTDAFTLWNRCRGIQVEDLAGHGTLVALLAELRDAEFTLAAYELCPLVSEQTRVAGLTLIRNEPTVDAAAEQPSLPVVFSCVMDQNPRMVQQTVIWAISLIHLAQQPPESLVVHTVGPCAPPIQRFFDALGVRTEVVAPVDARYSHGNKLAQLTSPALQAADYLVLCDCDVAVVESLADWIIGDAIRAKMVDAAMLPLSLWERIFREARLPFPATRAQATHDHAQTIPCYVNGGLIILSRAAFKALRRAWPRWNRWLLDRPELFDYDFALAMRQKFAFSDQIGFTLSCFELGLLIDPLPLGLNFPTHWLPVGTDVAGIKPAVLHYHDRMDSSAYLLPVQVASVDQQIQKVNEALKAVRATGLDYYTYNEYRYFVDPALGSGMGSRGHNLELKRQMLATQIKTLAPASVLDIGCGDLETTRHLDVAHYLGVDISPTGVGLAREKRQDWDFRVGDPLELALEPRDLVICLDVLIHQASQAKYEALCRRLVELSRRHLIVAGYDGPPEFTSEITHYYEPLAQTFSQLAGGEMRPLTRYRDVTVWLWSRAEAEATSSGF